MSVFSIIFILFFFLFFCFLLCFIFDELIFFIRLNLVLVLCSLLTFVILGKQLLNVRSFNFLVEYKAVLYFLRQLIDKELSITGEIWRWEYRIQCDSIAEINGLGNKLT